MTVELWGCTSLYLPSRDFTKRLAVLVGSSAGLSSPGWRSIPELWEGAELPTAAGAAGSQVWDLHIHLRPCLGDVCSPCSSPWKVAALQALAREVGEVVQLPGSTGLGSTPRCTPVLSCPSGLGGGCRGRATSSARASKLRAAAGPFTVFHGGVFNIFPCHLCAWLCNANECQS